GGRPRVGIVSCDYRPFTTFASGSKRMRRTCTMAIVGLMVTFCLAGCAQQTPRQQISGTVYYRGKALDRGHIEFLSLGDQGGYSGAMIKNGTFTIPAAKGLEPGTYVVKIYSPDSIPLPATAPPGLGPVAPAPNERIAAKYNLSSELRAEVTKRGTNV